ncbi:MAG TPA: hypothetical protein VJB06_03225, partial [archaeon]|nr:hypothetical protein [archaeon]
MDSHHTKRPAAFIKRLAAFIGISFLCLFFIVPSDSQVSSDKTIFISSLVWRLDGTGDWTFETEGKLNGTQIAKDGSVEYSASPGVYELKKPYVTEGAIYGMTINWSFTGMVTLEVSA